MFASFPGALDDFNVRRLDSDAVRLVALADLGGSRALFSCSLIRACRLAHRITLSKKS